jgi:septation ring formation regulator EzrA
MLNLFRRPKIDTSYVERQVKLENDIAVVRGELNNILQTVESGSREVDKRLRRLENIERVLEIRGSYGEKHDSEN